jgi:hypothetical protein
VVVVVVVVVVGGWVVVVVVGGCVVVVVVVVEGEVVVVVVVVVEVAVEPSSPQAAATRATRISRSTVRRMFRLLGALRLIITWMPPILPRVPGRAGKGPRGLGEWSEPSWG